MDFEPFRKANTSLYLMDNKFHTEFLLNMLPQTKYVGSPSPSITLHHKMVFFPGTSQAMDFPSAQSKNEGSLCSPIPPFPQVF